MEAATVSPIRGATALVTSRSWALVVAASPTGPPNSASTATPTGRYKCSPIARSSAGCTASSTDQMRPLMRFSSAARSASNPASIRSPSTMSSCRAISSSVSGKVRAALESAVYACSRSFFLSTLSRAVRGSSCRNSILFGTHSAPFTVRTWADSSALLTACPGRRITAAVTASPH